MKIFLSISRIVFSLSFLTLFINHIRDLESKFIKFSSFNVVAEYHLSFGYYFMTAFELISVLLILINLRSRFYRIYDFLLAVYVVFVAVLLIALSQSYECIECHYVANAFYLDYKKTLIIIVCLALLYYFVITNKKIAGYNK